MAWDYASQLYNAEVNVRWQPWARVTMLAGFRFVDLGEDLQGTLPPQRTVPFWDTHTRNYLYGFQIGADGKLCEYRRFSLDIVAKAGLFDNVADETAGVSIYRTVYGESATTTHAAFVGEIDLACRYQIAPTLSLKLGYEVLWLEGVALAPGQIRKPRVTRSRRSACRPSVSTAARACSITAPRPAWSSCFKRPLVPYCRSRFSAPYAAERGNPG